MKVRLHVDRLVLDGIAVACADRPRLKAAFEAELERLIGEGGLDGSFDRGLGVPSVRADGFRYERGAGPDEIGRRIAGALYGGLRR